STRTRRTKPRSRNWRNSCAWPPCCCMATACSVRATAAASTDMRSVTGIPVAEFARRRRQLMRMAGGDARLVLPAAPPRVRSHATHYPYRQDSDFWYLCGFPEPDAVLVLVPGRKHGEALLFCRERDPEREAW